MPIRPKQPKALTKTAAPDPDNFRIKAPHGKTEARVMADVSIDPAASATMTTKLFGKGSFGTLSVTDIFEAVREQVAASESGDHSAQRALLIAQSISLDAIFTEMARRAANNMGSHLEATERFMRLALKAQAQSRATVEALDRLTNGHEQIVRHVHVDNRGGQAVIAETVHTGGQRNGKTDDQPHAPDSPVAGRTALPSPDPFGNGVPVPSRKRVRAVPDARREG